ncbi:tRNA guanosine(34) transglycosylase Tgt [Neolewinella lacunae]|uniref:Queuine tRNA-ribosyltransferase n=1 Tax=Neolewinella lacunae TaxID=1517758 RepID=A0A923PLM1_9BACT|nr:tRNA guanosine(34) transglycosylase Tgt [Neolewinella lacunae]MBC6992767.1 tRNA guanosine(34) transglycosylase Tgt [Neolewinella lacunae]MDN3636011.1 tRNA guanosine(34) transglycosylase Tgt [Neolewinella lacunae]
MQFTLHHTDTHTAARAGTLRTDHGEIPTPIFMPVGTLGTVKGVHQHELRQDVGARIILGNTYHLYLRPGTEVLEAAGGLHQFMAWDGPILTDSGGYQVFSLAHRRKITEEGATFASHIDGSKHLFSPESSLGIQRSIGADIVMAFDECPPYPSERRYAENSMHLTHRWLERCVAFMDASAPLYGHSQALFPIVQGSSYDDLRRVSAEFIAGQDQPGNAIGGLSVGEPIEDMYRITALCCEILPASKPRYLMGVGTPANILECISRGVDMFDCVLPSRNARHGVLYTRQGIINIKNARWRTDYSVLDPAPAAAPTSRTHTRAYLHHLFRVNELLGPQIATLHNLAFYLGLVTEARERILDGSFGAWKDQILPDLERRL